MKKSRRASESISRSEVKKKGCSNLGCALFSLPFFLAGAVVIYFLFVGPAVKIFRAQSWNPTPCTIISSKVGGSGDTHSIEIVYSYTVDGQQYQSDRYDFVDASTSGYEGKAEIVNQNPPGKIATCYVSPANPSDAVFSRSFSSDMWFGLFGLPFLLVGAVGFYVAARNALKTRRGAKELKAKPASPWPTFDTIRYRNPSPTAQNESDPQPSPFQQDFFQSSSFQPDSFQSSSLQQDSVQPASFQEPSYTEAPAQTASVSPVAPIASSMPGAAFERVVLEPAITPGCRLIGVTIFAVIWNAVVAAFGGWSFEKWDDGNLAWIPNLFLSPFALIGVAAIGAVGYYFLAMFNPRPKLTLSPAQLRLGEPFDLEWEFSGSNRAVNKFRLYIEGREEATYRRGTTTTTDRSVFATIQIVERPTAEHGRARVTMPGNTMHSFKSENNKIVWNIHAQGDIRFWPDVKEAFEIEVLPKRTMKTGEV
jgi:hypothetical protein